MASILCVDDEPAVLDVLQHLLRDMGHDTIAAGSADEAIQAIHRGRIDLILLDCVMPGRDGFAVLDHLTEQSLKIPTIMMTGYSSVEHAVAAIRGGAVDYLTKPLRAESVRISVTSALQLDRLRREREEIRREVTNLRGTQAIVGESEALHDVLEAIDVVAPTHASVLIHGEPGTGKQLFAREIHAKSPRHDQPFVSIRCADIHDTAAGNPLFGDARPTGSAPPIHAAGALERSSGGTLHLEEIAGLELGMQARLVRVLKEEAIERFGWGDPIKVDVRIVATTSHELGAEAEAGRFNHDLYARISLVSIRTPSLRERLEDIPTLVQHFAKQKALEFGLAAPAIPSETYTYLQGLSWPGNVHELANTIERAMIINPAGPLTPEALGRAIVPSPVESNLIPPSPELPPSAGSEAASGAILNLRELQQIAIRQALQKTGGHKTKAAELLGINERTLRNKLKGGDRTP